MATSPPLKLQGLEDVAEGLSSEDSSEEIKEMMPAKGLTTRVRSECFKNNAMDFDDHDKSEDSSSDGEDKQVSLVCGAFHIGKDNDE